MGLDKDIIADKMMAQGQRPAWVISQPEIGGVKLSPPEYSTWPREKRLAEAKKLLNEAGFNEAHPLRTYPKRGFGLYLIDSHAGVETLISGGFGHQGLLLKTASSGLILGLWKERIAG